MVPATSRDAFTRAGATYYSVDVDSDLADDTGSPPDGSSASGTDLPFRTGSFDVAYSSNVLEHVSDPWRVADEMLRVVRPGGLAFISYTVWYGPWGGHETAPWHFLGGHRARRRYVRRLGREPKNRFGESLFARHGPRRHGVGPAPAPRRGRRPDRRATTRAGRASCSVSPC